MSKSTISEWDAYAEEYEAVFPEGEDQRDLMRRVIAERAGEPLEDEDEFEDDKDDSE